MRSAAAAAARPAVAALSYACSFSRAVYLPFIFLPPWLCYPLAAGSPCYPSRVAQMKQQQADVCAGSCCGRPAGAGREFGQKPVQQPSVATSPADFFPEAAQRHTTRAGKRLEGAGGAAACRGGSGRQVRMDLQGSHICRVHDTNRYTTSNLKQPTRGRSLPCKRGLVESQPLQPCRCPNTAQCLI